MSSLPEIEELLQEEEITTHAAIRLMLRSQAEMSKDIAIIKKTAALATVYNERYPSLTWLLKHKTKSTVALAFGVFAVFYGLFVPITISDIRQAIIAALSVVP